MFEKKCDGPNCEEKVFVYAKDKQGNLPVAFHSKQCEANAKYEKRFDNRFNRK